MVLSSSDTRIVPPVLAAITLAATVCTCLAEVFRLAAHFGAVWQTLGAAGAVRAQDRG
jgi:hypothetical protein